MYNNSLHIETAINAEISRPKNWRKSSVKTGWKTSLNRWHEIEDTHGRKLDDNIFLRSQREKTNQYNLLISNIYFIMENLVKLTQDNAKLLRTATIEQKQRNTQENLIAIAGEQYKTDVMALNWSYIFEDKNAENIDARLIEEVSKKQELTTAINSNIADVRKERNNKEKAQKYVNEALQSQLLALCGGDAEKVKECNTIAQQLNVDVINVAKYVAVSAVTGKSLIECVQTYSAK